MQPPAVSCMLVADERRMCQAVGPHWPDPGRRTMAETIVMIATRKGLFLARSSDGRRTWDLDGPHLSGAEIASCAIDTRGDRPRLLAGGFSWHWGPFLVHSDDLGATWDDPAHARIAFPPDTGEAVKNLWQIAPDTPERPGVVWVGSEPSALWRSEDGGDTFELVRGLWDHPDRPKWEPGGGGQTLHTILPHPSDDQRISVAMSTGGLYRSQDGGASWAPSNSGLEAGYQPEPPPPYGFCVHKVARDPADPDLLFQQHHGGVYSSTDEGGSWNRIDDGLPADFGFPIVTHPRDSGTAYVFPLTADMDRTPPDGRCAVYRTRDGGGSWEARTDGLPSDPFHVGVLRDAMCVDTDTPAGIYVGTRHGSVYASSDEGDHWGTIAQHLPDVFAVRAATID
jgi:hypothetical protein